MLRKNINRLVAPKSNTPRTNKTVLGVFDLGVIPLNIQSKNIK